MGRPRIKTIDDSVNQNQEERIKKQAKKTAKKVERAKVDAASRKETKSEPVKTIKESIPSVILEGTQQPIESNKKDAIASLQHDNKETKKPQKPGKAKPRSLPQAKSRGKKYQELVKDLDRTKLYPIDEAVDMVRKMSYAKFNATLEAHITTAQTGIRGLVSLPYSSGRKLNILAFGKGADTSGADIVGSDETIEEINKGKINFDLVVTTPEWMSKLAKVAKILGHKGLMPNPKNNTITDDLKKTVGSFQAGKTEYKTEPKIPVVHLALGKLNQPTEDLTANVKTLLQALGKSRVKKVTLSPTMGPGVKVDLTSI